MECLNEFSGLFSLLAVVASVAAIVVAVVIYRKQKQQQLQDLKDELEAIEHYSALPMGHNERKHFVRKSYLQKKLGRK